MLGRARPGCCRRAQDCPQPKDKVRVLKEMIFPQCEKLGQTIIFVRTRETARALHSEARAHPAPARPLATPVRAMTLFAMRSSRRQGVNSQAGSREVRMIVVDMGVHLTSASKGLHAVLAHAHAQSGAWRRSVHLVAHTLTP